MFTSIATLYMKLDYGGCGGGCHVEGVMCNVEDVSMEGIV